MIDENSFRNFIMPLRFKFSFLIILSALFIPDLSFSSALEYDPVTEDLPSIDKENPPAFYEVFIPVAGIKLTGFILKANGKGPHPTVVLVHGLPGNEKNLDLAQSMRRAGFNVLFFHYRGSWGSQGDYSFLTLHEDILAALKFLRLNADKYQIDSHHISLVGHSFGGYAVLRAASMDKNLSCIVGISAANPALIAHSSRVKSTETANIGKYIDQLIMLRNFPGAQAIFELIEHAREMDTRNYGDKLIGKNILLIVGEQDKTVPPSVQKANVEQYQKVKGLSITSKIIPGDHAFSISRIRLQHEVISWMNANCV